MNQRARIGTRRLRSPRGRAAVAWRGVALVALLSTAAAFASMQPIPAQQAPAPTEVEAPESPAKVHRHGDLVSVFSGDVHVPADVEQHGDVVCVGATARIEGEVLGDVVVIAGSVELSGRVRGGLVGVLSDMTMRNAEVERDLVNVLGGMDRRETTVGGQFVNVGVGSWFPGLTALIFWLRLIGKLLVFVLLLLLVALVPERIRLIGEEASSRYLPALFVGLLVYLALLVLLTILSATIIGVPLLILLFWVLKWLGIAGLFYAVGRGLGRALGREMSVLGAVLLCFALYLIVMLAPTPLGWLGLAVVAFLWSLFFLLVEAPAVGLVLLTRFGTRAEGGPAPAGGGTPSVDRTLEPSPPGVARPGPEAGRTPG